MSELHTLCAVAHSTACFLCENQQWATTPVKRLSLTQLPAACANMELKEALQEPGRPCRGALAGAVKI